MTVRLAGRRLRRAVPLGLWTSTLRDQDDLAADMALLKQAVGLLDLAQRERRGDRHLQFAVHDQPGSSASTLALAPAALPSALIPYFSIASNLAIVSIREGSTPS